MNKKITRNNLGHCGLVCILCNEEGNCNCRQDRCTGKRTTEYGCYQYECSNKKGYFGCWECKDSPCGVDVHSKERVKVRGFITFIKRNSLNSFLERLMINRSEGVKYHTNGIWGRDPISGDYDLKDEEEVYNLLKGNKK